MRHQQVMENFVKEGKGGYGTFVKANDEMIYTQMPQVYRPYGQYGWNNVAGRRSLLAVRLDDGSILANGARLGFPMQSHQLTLLHTLERENARFAVVPFHSIVAAFTNGKVRDWDEQPVPMPDLKREVSVVVPSTGEEWRTVTEKDDKGRERTRSVHTLGDSVIRLRESYYISAVDETGVGRGLYFLTELKTRRAPQSLADALEMLKPNPVREAEREGLEVRRQGEWFGIPQRVGTRDLMRDVRGGMAVFSRHHVLGRDGHHRLTEAVIYKVGDRKGEVYGRGSMRHTLGEHRLLPLPQVWYRILHSTQGQSYSLGGRGLQFD